MKRAAAQVVIDRVQQPCYISLGLHIPMISFRPGRPCVPCGHPL